MAVQARPGATLVVAEPEFLFAILMEALDGPALVGQSEVIVERAIIQVPGEVPLRLAVLPRQGTLADEPAARAGGVAVGTLDAQPAGLSSAAPLVGIEDGDRRPLLVGDATGQLPRRVQWGDLGGMGTRARPTTPECLRHRPRRRFGDFR